MFRFRAGCPCCHQFPPPVNCLVCYDPFTGSDSSDIDAGSSCGWSEINGDWSRSSNALAVSSSNAIATAGADSPEVPRSLIVRVRGTNAGNQARLIFGYADSDNYWFVQVNFSTTAGYIRLYQRSGGTDVERHSTASNLNIGLNVFHTIMLCYDGARVEARLIGNPGAVTFYNSAGTISALKNGLGTGAVATGTVSFDDYEVRRLSGLCPCPLPIIGSSGDQGCIYCTGLRGPYMWRVDIAGITDNACVNCDNWNATYYLTPNSNNRCFPVTENTSCCCWTAPNGGDACEENIHPNIAGEYSQVTLQVCAAYDGFPAGIRVRMFRARTGGFIVWQWTHSIPIDCRNIAALDVPVLSGTPSLCNQNSSTCTIWAMP